MDATVDFKQLREALDREPDPLTRFQLAQRNLEAWINAEPLSALDWLSSQQPTARRNDVIRMALAQFAENDPKGAAGWALENLSGTELNNTLLLIAEEWARVDGNEAANWLTALPAAAERDAALETLLFAWAAEKPAEAIGYLSKFPDSGELPAVLRQAAFAGWVKSDPRGAVAASLESSRAHKDPWQFANTLANWATMDLAGSSQWLLDNIPGAPERGPAVSELAGVFAHQAPDAGIEWIGKLKPGSERDLAANRLASEWAAVDPAAAAKWIGTQDLGKIEEETSTEILHSYLLNDIPGFEAWSASLPDGPLKARAAQVRELAVGEDE